MVADATPPSMIAHANRITRRRLLAGLGALTLGAFIDARYVEPGWFEVSEVEVPFFRSPRHPPLRVLHLSDLHLSSLVPLAQIEHAVELGLGLRPDLICLTGDYVTAHVSDSALRDYSQVLRRLSSYAPCYAVLGNHDGGTWASNRYGIATPERMVRLLETSQISVLQNASVPVEIQGVNLRLVGVQDYWSKPWQGIRAFERVSQEQDIVVLSHNPDSKRELGNVPWKLMLSGHTHGGQLRVPLIGMTPYAPIKDMRYVAGLNAWGERWIYTTRGVGNILGMRFNCRPEISLLRLR